MFRIHRVVASLCVLTCVAIGQDLAQRIDRLVDQRWNKADTTLDSILEILKEKEISLADLEAAIRAPRRSYPKVEAKVGAPVYDLPLTCEHFDHETLYQLFIPTKYDPKRATPLVIVGHGGNGSMSKDRANKTAKAYLRYWTDAAEQNGVITVAPDTTRGWVSYGNSILFSLISKLTREFNIDPDRIYVTGQSMGGHLSYRSGITFADRFGAVGPQSGGYDYVENLQVINLFNIPGYATFGKDEPYNINVFNRTIRDWMKERDYPWKIVEKNGGHEIYKDEITKQYEFYLEHPRPPTLRKSAWRCSRQTSHRAKIRFCPRPAA
jgi:hypothetical protein